MADYKTAIQQIYIKHGTFETNDSGMIYLGINRKTEPNWNGWKYIDYILQIDQNTTTQILKNNSILLEQVYDYYKKPFFELSLQDCYSQPIAELILKHYQARGMKNTKYLLSKIKKNINKLILSSDTKFILLLLQLVIQHLGVCYERKPILTNRFLIRYLRQVFKELESLIDLDVLNKYFDCSNFHNLKIALDTNEFYAIPKLIYQV